MTWALLPLKDLVQAKSRLSGLLAPFERRALAQAMAEDVLAALAACPRLEGILLISDDPGADLLARKYAVELLPESTLAVTGLNPVVRAGCEHLRKRGAGSVMVVHSDLPLLTAAELGQLLDAWRAADVDLLISPDRHRDGTNILLLSSRCALEFHYGVGSCQAHLDAAAEAGLRAELQPLAGAGLDVDQPSDLIDLWQLAQSGGPLGEHTRRFLAGNDVHRRLSVLAESDQYHDRSAR